MTPLAKLLRNGWEKLFGTFHEGPDAPDRIEQVVFAFMAHHPKATRQQWAAFASLHASQSYGSGYQRGYEWAERDLDQKPADSPEVINHHESHELMWTGQELLSLNPDFDPNADMDEVVLDGDSVDAIQQHVTDYERLWEQHGRTDLGKKYSR